MEAHDGRLSRRETGIQIGKSKHHIGDQMLKNGKSASHNEQPIQKIKFFWHQNRSKKKPKIPMPPSRMNRSVKSTCVDCIRIPTNDNTATNIISETSTKTFFFSIRNMLQNNFSHTIFCTEGVMSCNRIIHRLRTLMLDTL